MVVQVTYLFFNNLRKTAKTVCVFLIKSPGYRVPNAFMYKKIFAFYLSSF